MTPDPQASQLPPHPLDLILRETKNDAAEEAGMKDASKKETALRSLDASVFDGVNFDSFFGPGVRYQRVREGYLAFPPTVPDQTFLLKVEHGGGDPSKPKFVSSHAQTPSVTALRNADSPVMPPSFLNPKSRFLQTGAAAEERRRNDSGSWGGNSGKSRRVLFEVCAVSDNRRCLRACDSRRCAEEAVGDGGSRE